MGKKTAVEWFYQRILANDIKEVFEQAKEMEKKQIKKAYNHDRPNLLCYEKGKAFKEYYNKTFNK